MLDKFYCKCFVCGKEFSHTAPFIDCRALMNGLVYDLGWSFAVDEKGNILQAKCPKCTKEGVGK